MLKKITLAMASAALLAAPAVAAQERETETTGVTIADLDLNTQEGRDELDRRIDRAAKDVCNYGEVTVGTRLRSRDARHCYRSAKREMEQHFAQIIEERHLGG